MKELKDIFEPYDRCQRLIGVLCRADVATLAKLLHYYKPELQNDIDALEAVFYDYMQKLNK